MMGGDVRESVRRGLAKIFSNKLARKCSYYGRKQNHPIKDLQCIKILKGNIVNFSMFLIHKVKYLLSEALRERFGSSFTDKDFENLVAQWLKQAELRYKRERAT